MKKFLVILLVVFVLCGCAVTPVSSSSLDTSVTSQVINPSSTYSGITVYSDNNFTVVRFVDTEKNVTCWLMDGYHSGGIYCLPNN